MLIHQERDLVSIGQFGILCHLDATVMVVIAQRYIHGCDGTQMLEKAKEMRQAFRHVEQISRDENPIWAKLLYSADNLIMSRVITVEVQVGEMDGTTTRENGMSVG